MSIKKTIIIAVILAACLILPAAAEIEGYSKDTGYQYALLGSYPTEKDGTAAPILWRVMSVSDGGAYLMSEYILDAKRVDGNKNSYAGWASSELRQWLDGEFADTAFSSREKYALKPLADGSVVSLMTADEVKDPDLGFRDLRDRLARATAYARAQGIDTYAGGGVRYSPWWLRDVSSDNANQQRRVIDEGKLGRGTVASKDQGVRPCVTVDLKVFTVTGGTGTKDDPWVLEADKTAAPVTPVPEATQAPATAEPAQTDADPGPTPAPTDDAEPTQGPDESPAGDTGHTASGRITASTDGMSEKFPQMAADGFLPEGEAEFVYEDQDSGTWLYASRTLRVEIHRRSEEKKPLRWYEAEIWCQPESDMFTTYAFDEAKYTNHNRLTSPSEIARQHKLVFAMNTDFFIYRVERDREESYNYPIGIVIRRGNLMYDRPKKPTSTVYPPLDVVALYPDGRVATYLNAETTGEALIADGVRDALSFGPVLMQEGRIIPRATAYGEVDNPRTAFGCVSPGHYWCVLLEGRMSKTYSKGASCGWMAETMARLGCETAINLDGGQTACMLFMGSRINKIGTYDGKTTDRDRPQNELLGIGQSALVGN